MRAKNKMRTRQFSSLLNEHWKRKQRLKRKRAEEKKVNDVLSSFGDELHLEDSLNGMHLASRPRSIEVETKATERDKVLTRRRCALLITFTTSTCLLFFMACSGNAQSALIQSDPRPTIYSGQVSFGLLLSAHSSLGAELSTSASSQQVNSILAIAEGGSTTNEEQGENGADFLTTSALFLPSSTATSANESATSVSSANITTVKPNESQASDILLTSETSSYDTTLHRHDKRQIFEMRAGGHSQQQQQQRRHQQQPARTTPSSALTSTEMGLCSQINPNALYAGMGAIWASHQANLVGDSHLAIGTYVYDSCNDLDVAQRQSVRIVSNLNAFQQTTCESPRGSPISLTIAHGDNQLKAIQLLTSFKVPVITTREHFALEDFDQLSQNQKRFLFSTAHSSRHLALGALRFSKSVVSRSTNSPKLPNQFHKMSSKNGLIVISRNLPAKFISYLTSTIRLHVNYEMLQSNQPIDQIKSVEALESILFKNQQETSSSSESRISTKRISSNLRRKRRESAPNSDEDSSGDEQSSGEQENPKMLSPTILMFITPSEAIDLVTRLRNDLAEVSRYYSLIVTTREDISPALKTIFHRGGSRLCSGKAFYTISPKPDDVSEFSRYFRDTVQMEGESSDHPLICEFAKYQSMSKISADLDDISTEPVIKAVWSAAAAFKHVYKHECGSQSNQQQAGTTQANSNIYRAADSNVDSNGGRSGRQFNNGSRSECMVKMNKNMSNLVQRALRKLNVSINSTGLQALDGFRIKFDEENELMTNKFSIKYINKECEITELGQYSGFEHSKLRLDEETLIKSLESTLPDPWPVSVLPASTPAPAVTSPTESSTVSNNNNNELLPTKETRGDASSDSPSGVSSTESVAEKSAKQSRGRRKHKSNTDESIDSERSYPSTLAEPDEDGANEEAPKRQSKRSRASGREASSESSVRDGRKKKRPPAAPVTAMGGRDILPGLTDTTEMEKAHNDRTTSASSFPEAGLTTRPMRKLKPFPSSATGTTLNEWLPTGSLTTQTIQKVDLLATKTPNNLLSGLVQHGPNKHLLHNDNEQVDPGGDLKARATTQAPVFSTLPESGGNADLEPTVRVSKSVEKKDTTKLLMDTSATTETSDYVTSPSISKNVINQPTTSTEQTNVLARLGFAQSRQNAPTEHPFQLQLNQTSKSYRYNPTEKINHFKDLNSSPVPLISITRSYLNEKFPVNENPRSPGDFFGATAEQQAEALKTGRSRLRAHLRWIYGSWFTLTILCANICGALLTLYVITFLLLKNCDGSLGRENQGMRSLHLLAIIVVFFGSTLFIVYPTPGLCLLRTSWYNFALVLLFGTLLLQTMQTRSLKSIGLGGRLNRLNQFLTLVFMVGVQIAFELQRWKYESANYINFVSHYFGSSDSEDKKLIMLSSAISNQLNPLNSFNDQIMPVSIQMSEQYQNLLHDYCLQQADDFFQSQIYICIMLFLLLIFSASTRNSMQMTGSKKSHHKLTADLITSGKSVVSQHEANLNVSPSHFQFSPNTQTTSSGCFETGNVFTVTLIIAPIYSASIIFHIYGHNIVNRDLVSSITLVLIAFTALIGIFLPILLRLQRFENFINERIPGSLTRPVIKQSKIQADSASASAAFTMFPEFAPTGLRRPSSGSRDSSSAGSRRQFADTKESRRNMSIALANLVPSEDSLRSLGLYSNNNDNNNRETTIDPAMLNLKLNLSANDDPNDTDIYPQQQHHRQQQITINRKNKSEKRLIMLDVDPCCPRHGTGAWQQLKQCGEHSSSSKTINGSRIRNNRSSNE